MRLGSKESFSCVEKKKNYTEYPFQLETAHLLVNLTYTEKETSIMPVDDSMKLLFNDGNGSVYKICVSWLSSGDQHLEISGCLAVGNFGRTGMELNRQHCARDF